jgi:2-polyprenyl-3-methyl-5-hydroxy-6-metoxy-1,4-benzoquinol methylase
LKMNFEYEYCHLERFSRDIGIPKENLVEAFEIERDFHKKILLENDRQKRKQMYREVYERVHLIYGKSSNTVKTQNPKDRIVRLFRKELEGKSILDVGCGEGYFLISVASQLDHKKLVGVDISTSVLPKNQKDIQFINADIVDFDLSEQFDVVFCDQVLEHIAPLDLPIHLSSVRNALKPDGTFIILMPNKLFGPYDVTRIVDYTYTGQLDAMGTHLNESTYTEMIPILKQYGFNRFYTIVPIPKLKYLFPYLRIDPSLLTYVENNQFLLNILYGIRWHSVCIARLEVVLICR